MKSNSLWEKTCAGRLGRAEKFSSRKIFVLFEKSYLMKWSYRPDSQVAKAERNGK